ncbi:hypothetical protein [uncultured Treponema sp.]|uniref:hypothetical protein n=1 Tax=uncultured Treponema sp. TaxID=162155 RepID=UPI002600A493|nr:hypothetical protein [uncultured Treponema sp.]
MITEQQVTDFMKSFDYDIRKSHNGRWIDQKCTPDVISFIADCICYFANKKPDEEFTSQDIWFSDYAVKNTEAVFKKPSPKQNEAKNEYDKFFQQPMKLFANAQLMTERKEGVKNIYRINNFEILEYISLSEKNALKFLHRYIEKVLIDSEMICYFQKFFDYQKNIIVNKDKLKMLYNELREQFFFFTHRYTLIKGQYEPGRIFTKVINPLAYFNNAYGTERGHVSLDLITYDVLMYNRNNFRDIYANKPKGITRKAYAEKHHVEINEKYYEYQSSKAKRFLRIFNDQYRNGLTEHLEKNHLSDKAIHIHHIFPKALYPEICAYLENLIALTPTQHYNYAHKNGHTQEINIEYQHQLLLSKADRIKENIEESYSEKIERIYEFPRFLHVLSVGFDEDDVETIADMDFTSVMNAINVHYAKK